MRGGGIVWETLRIRINLHKNCLLLLHNPSVSLAAASSLYTREPFLFIAKSSYRTPKHSSR